MDIRGVLGGSGWQSATATVPSTESAAVREAARRSTRHPGVEKRTESAAVEVTPHAFGVVVMQPAVLLALCARPCLGLFVLRVDMDLARLDVEIDAVNCPRGFQAEKTTVQIGVARHPNIPPLELTWRPSLGSSESHTKPGSARIYDDADHK
jgi:hypothetical protein